ncbi:MAG: hypothetical protein EU544_03040 [Promethearchaeota archaeon]|nr:MAG: hypothetical protein EU544_03040 [Candidatus Lokiarchaeota archaeon]
MANFKKIRKKTVNYLDRCAFYIDTNNLIEFDLIKRILVKVEDEAIERLNEVLKGLRIYIGGHHRNTGKLGYFTNETYEFDFHKRRLTIFLAPIFKLGFTRWKKTEFGALLRYVWESFCHEIIMALIFAMKINTSLMEEAQGKDLNKFDEVSRNFFDDLLHKYDGYIPRINFISINNKLWKEELPEKFGFLRVLYNREIKQMKKHLAVPRYPQFLKVKIFNELRKIKLGYKYEYNLSELINYCIHNDRFEDFFKNNWKIYKELQREFYYKGKRIVLKFFKEYDIPLKEYRDSANRRHFFITHEIFERVKSVCLQRCIAKLESKYLEGYWEFKAFYAQCPICKTYDINDKVCQEFYFSENYNYFKELLLEGMQNAGSLEELNDESYYFGIPCPDCFSLVRNIQGRFEDLELVKQFVIAYSVCPVCHAKNHKEYLLDFFYEDERAELKELLIKNIKNHNRYEKLNINLGIPCCLCFEELFGEPPAMNLLADLI